MLEKRSFGLDVLRTLAISFVLLAHFAKIFESIGFWGVELFFALSGYLIGKIIWKSYYSNNNYSFKLVLNFWKRRWWRTIPNYWLFLVVMVIFQWFKSSQITNGSTVLKTIFFIQNFTSREEGFYSVSWSLCIEEWFYLLFPLLLLLLSFLKLSRKTTYLLCISIFIVSSVFIRLYLIEQNVGHSLRGITLARLDAIVFGVAIAFITKIVNGNYKVLFYMFIAGSLLLVFCLKQVHFSSILYNEIRSQQLYLMLAPLSFSLIIPKIEKFEMKFIQTNWIKKSIQNISLWSYSIYLSHIPILFFSYYLTSSFRVNSLGNLASKILGLIFTIFISALVYKYFEKPITDKRPNAITG
ncbi:MAG: acyltransferase family protein [Bacteroidia bacterium]